MWQDMTVRQTMHGLAAAWQFFPESWGVRCNGLMTPREAFEDDSIFRRVIARRMRLGDNVSDAGIRKMLRMFSGVQGVSNFRPSAAAAIYSLFGGGVVWDMSAGFGGRLVGAAGSGVVRRYIGNDPCAATITGMRKLSDTLPISCSLYQCGSEDFVPDEAVDICFTSPPYFSTELYSDEPTQSALRFPEYSQWVHGYLRQTIQNCRHALKPDGWLVLNVANTPRCPTLVSDTATTCGEEGFIGHPRRFYALSQLNGGGFKREPLLVFRRPA